MIQHCGQLGMIGCPISIDWTVEHDFDKIVIIDIKKYPETDNNKVIKYECLTATFERKNTLRNSQIL